MQTRTEHGVGCGINRQKRKMQVRMAFKPVRISELEFDNGNIAGNLKSWKQVMQSAMLQGPLAEKNEKQ